MKSSNIHSTAPETSSSGRLPTPDKWSNGCSALQAAFAPHRSHLSVCMEGLDRGSDRRCLIDSLGLARVSSALVSVVDSSEMWLQCLARSFCCMLVAPQHLEKYLVSHVGHDDSYDKLETYPHLSQTVATRKTTSEYNKNKR